MSTTSSDCCCLWALLRRRKRGSRRMSMSEDSLIGLPHPQSKTLRGGVDRRELAGCCLVKQRAPNEGLEDWISTNQKEAIELKCYSLSKDQVIVSLDKRCCLLTAPNGSTRTRPFSCIEDGRRHLDTCRRPDRVSLIKLYLDPDSGQLQRSLSIHEIDSDCEFEECKQLHKTHMESKSVQLDHEALAKKLSQRSLVIVERNSSASKRRRHSLLVLDIPDEADGDDGELAPPLGSPSDEQVKSLEHDLVESLSLGPDKSNYTGFQAHREEPKYVDSYEHVNEQEYYEQQPQQQHHQPRQQVVNERKLDVFKDTTTNKTRRRKPLKFVAKRLAHWIGHSRRNDIETGSEHDDTPASKIHDTPPSDIHHPPQTGPSEETQGQLVALGRPESIFLRPKRVSDAYASTITAGSLTSSCAEARRAKRPSASIMISYNHMEAKEYAIALHAALEAANVSAYLDLYEIQKGEDWQDSLNFAILDCRVFVPLITPSYGETLWTSRECKLADVLAKRIVPINFGLRWPPPSLAIQFATLQYIDWLHHEMIESVLDPHMMKVGGSGWPTECVQAIARQLKACLESCDLILDAAKITTEKISKLDTTPMCPMVEIERGVSTEIIQNNDKRQREHVDKRSTLLDLNMGTLNEISLVETPASSCNTTSSSSPSCYDSMAESARSAATNYSPPGGSPTLLEELAESSNFVLVPTVSARVSAKPDDDVHRDLAVETQPPPPPPPSPPKQRKRSLGQRTKKVLTRLKSSLAARSSAGA